MNHAFTIIPLTIEARGEIITNNLPQVRELVREALSRINRELVSDEEFGQAEKDVKAMAEVEKALRTAAEKSFDDKLQALIDELKATAEEIRVPRLELEKLITKRKEELKSEIVEEFLAEFDIDPRDARKHYQSALKAQMSGKRTLESMRTACRVYQKAQQAMIIKSRASIERFVGKFGPDLVMDRRELELKNVEAVEAELLRRYEAKKAADEAAKLKAEADAAKADAAKAQAALAEANKPPAAPVHAPPSSVEQGPWKQEGTPNVELPTSNVEESAQLTADEEWQAFKAAAMAAFKPLKAAKAKLVYPKNAAKAQVFANAINAAWQEVAS